MYPHIALISMMKLFQINVILPIVNFWSNLLKAFLQVENKTLAKSWYQVM